MTDGKSVAAALGRAMSDVGEGYLVLADVSGYTGFLAGIELEHASGILAELIQEMLDGLTPPLELAGIEGDAVFAHGPGSAVARGETLLELIESDICGLPAAPRRDAGANDVHLRRLFTDRDRSTSSSSPTTAATRLQDLAGGRTGRQRGQPRPPPAQERSPDETGWRAYALFTEAALGRLGVATGTMHRRIERYDHRRRAGVARLDLRRAAAGALS